MKRILPVLLIVCMLLCACTQQQPKQTTTAPVVDTTIVAEEQTVAPETTVETTIQPETTDAVVDVSNYQNPLNGAPLAERYTARPYAVTINNIVYAQPMCGLSSADFVFEILAEGGITRCLAVYGDIRGLDHIGAIRSARPYLVDIAESFDAIYVHHGGSKDGYREINALDVDDLDAMGNGGSAYYRDQERLASGYDLEHTSFADGDDLIAEVEGLGYAAEREEGIDYGFQFAEASSTTAGESATELTADFGSYGKTTSFTYDETIGRYAAEQYGGGLVDGNTGTVVTYRNVLLITAETYSYEEDDGVRMHITLVDEGSGYFACDGKVVSIRWSRSGESESFVFTHEDGTPITLGVGNTYVAVTPRDGALTY